MHGGPEQRTRCTQRCTAGSPRASLRRACLAPHALRPHSVRARCCTAQGFGTFSAVLLSFSIIFGPGISHLFQALLFLFLQRAYDGARVLVCSGWAGVRVHLNVDVDEILLCANTNHCVNHSFVCPCSGGQRADQGRGAPRAARDAAAHRDVHAERHQVCARARGRQWRVRACMRACTWPCLWLCACSLPAWPVASVPNLQGRHAPHHAPRTLARRLYIPNAWLREQPIRNLSRTAAMTEFIYLHVRGGGAGWRGHCSVQQQAWAGLAAGGAWRCASGSKGS